MMLALLSMLGRCHALDPAKSMSQYVHDRWGRERGFPGGTVYAISQSEDGYLWLGTDRGLVRFDGERFSLIQQPVSEQPAIGPVRGLVEAADGGLWIRPQGPRLLLYRGGQFSDGLGPLGLSGATITAMGSDASRNVLFSGLEIPSVRYAHDSVEELSSASETAGTVVLSITQTRDGRVWLGTRDFGLLVIANGRSAVKAAPNLADDKINSLAPSDSGGLWVGTDQGLRFLSTDADMSVRIPAWTNDCQILAITKDLAGNMWAASSRGLIRVTPGGQFSLLPAGGNNTAGITAVFEDSEGSIWYGGPGGLERLQDQIFTTYSFEVGSPQTPGSALYVDADGRTWFAALSGGLYCMSHGRVDRIRLAGLDQDVVYSIAGQGNDIWVGRQHAGLTRITRTGNHLSAQTYTTREGLAQNTVFSTLIARDGAVWAGTINGGLSRFKAGVFTTYSVTNGLSSNAVNSLLEGYDGTIWVSTSEGLDALRGERWSHWSMKQGLPAADVRNCFEDSKHVLWAVTSSGLAYLSGERFLRPPSTPEALRDQIFGMAEDRLGFFWLSTMDSVVRLSRDWLVGDSRRESGVQSYGEANGLLGVGGVRRDRPIQEDRSGAIWVSVRDGVAKADPTMILRNSNPIRVRIESIIAGAKTFRAADQPRIGARPRSVSFGFAGASLQSPDRTWFRYVLEGADQDWSEPVQMRQVSYSNLGSGAYRFRVIASRDGFLWNGPETDAIFSVDQAYWETWWFRTCLLLALALLVLSVFRLRTLRLSRQLDARFQERLAERTRIAQELHDTLLQSFHGLMLRFQTVDTKLPSQPDEAKAMLQEALDRGDDALTESRNAIQNLRSSRAVRSELSHALAMVLETIQCEFSARDASRPTCSIAVEGEERTLKEQALGEISRIAREALRNAFQHAHASYVEVEISFRDRELRLSLRDDGVGIEPAVLGDGARSGHWGLIGMRERAARLGAGLTFWSRPGAGTEIELTVPGAIAYTLFPKDRFARFRGRIKC